MTLSALIADIRSWENYDQYTDNLVTSFVRLAEDNFNEVLMCEEQITVISLPVTNNKITLPSDFIDLDYIRHLGSGNSYSADVSRSHPLDAVSKDEYWRSVNAADNSLRSKYMRSGNYVYLCPTLTDGSLVELSYYAKLSPLTDSNVNWLFGRKRSVYLFGSLSYAAAYNLEYDKADALKSQAADIITALNNKSKQSRYGQASRIRPRIRSFG